jgi:hypothetical protein
MPGHTLSRPSWLRRTSAIALVAIAALGTVALASATAFAMGGAGGMSMGHVNPDEGAQHGVTVRPYLHPTPGHLVCVKFAHHQGAARKCVHWLLLPS